MAIPSYSNVSNGISSRTTNMRAVPLGQAGTSEWPEFIWLVLTWIDWRWHSWRAAKQGRVECRARDDVVMLLRVKVDHARH